MKRLILLASLVLAGCVPIKPPVVTPPQLREVAVQVTQCSTSTAIAGARVAFDEHVTTTNVDGHAVLELVVPARYTLTVTHDDFASEAGPYDLTATATLPVCLKPRPPPQPTTVRRATPTEVRTYAGYLTGGGCGPTGRDLAGRNVWTSALPGAPPEVRAEWLRCLAAKGATHVPIGPFTPGDVYPGTNWRNPDWTQNPAAIRALILEIQNTPTLKGHGMVPAIFLVSGDYSGQVEKEFPAIVPTLSAALEGIGEATITLPCGWESQAWLAIECKRAHDLWAPRRQGSVLAWHGWVDRSNGAPNDPFNPNVGPAEWLMPPVTLADGRVARYGDGARFWATTQFEMFFYQASPVQTLAEANCSKKPYTDEHGKSGLAYYVADCNWKAALNSSLPRVGASLCSDDFGDTRPCGWPTRIFVFFEALAYFDFRGILQPGTRDAVNDAVDEMCRFFAVTCGFGDGLPARLRVN